MSVKHVEQLSRSGHTSLCSSALWAAALLFLWAKGCFRCGPSCCSRLGLFPSWLRWRRAALPERGTVERSLRRKTFKRLCVYHDLTDLTSVLPVVSDSSHHFSFFFYSFSEVWLKVISLNSRSDPKPESGRHRNVIHKYSCLVSEVEWPHTDLCFYFNRVLFRQTCFVSV